MHTPVNVFTDTEKREVASQLAFLYLEKADISNCSPADLANKYLDARGDICRAITDYIVSKRTSSSSSTS